MKYNRFYNKNIFTAVSGSEVIFVYKRVKLVRNDGKVIYPFYLVIKPFQIEFNYYGPKYSTVQNHGDNDGEWEWANHGDEPELPELKHRELFTLTLSDDYSVNKMLEKELRKIYNDSIDLSRFLAVSDDEETPKEQSYHLQVNMDDFYQPANTSMQNGGRNKTERRLKKTDNNNHHTYLPSYNSILPIDELITYDTPEKYGIISYRTLLLDFLFDLIETEKQYSDFAYNPYFDEVEQRLMGNHFFFSLCMMYSYKFRRQKLVNEIYEKQISRKKISQQLTIIRNVAVMQNLKDDLQKDLQPARELTLSRANSIKALFKRYHVPQLGEAFIEHIGKNFDRCNTAQFYDNFIKSELIYHLDPEIRPALHQAGELNKAENSWLKALSHPLANETIDSSNPWFQHIEAEREYIFGIDKYESHSFFGRISTFFRNLFHFTRRTKNKFMESRLLVELNACTSLSHESFYSSENDKLDRSARWFLDRYNVSNALKLFSPWFTVFIKIFVTGVLIVTLLELVLLFNHDFQPGFNRFLMYANLFGIAFFVVFAVAVIIKSALILAASLAYRKSNRGLWFKSFLRIKYRQNRTSARMIGFFMPKLLMAIFSGWIILLTAEGVWKSIFDINIEKAVIIAFVLLIGLSVYVMLEIQKIRPSISISQVVVRTFFLIAFGLFYSSLIGITTTAASSNKMLIRSGYLENYFASVIDTDHSVRHLYIDTVSRNEIIKILKYRDSIAYAKDERLVEYLPKVLIHVNDSVNKLAFLPTKDDLSFLPEVMVKKLILISIFPGMLLVNTVIALFIGIFLQMLFDRRNIAEPI